MSTTWGEGIEDVGSQPKRKTPVDSLVMRSRRDIADTFTEVVASRLHYFDRIETIDFRFYSPKEGCNPITAINIR